MKRGTRGRKSCSRATSVVSFLNERLGGKYRDTVLESLTEILRTEREPEYAETLMPVRQMFDQTP